MARSVKEPPQPVTTIHPRKEELLRPDRRRREFTQREAQRRLQQKETPWAPIAYAVFLVAVLIIAFFAYTTYAFSKYRNEVLPGVKVDNVSVAGLTQKQAEKVINDREALIGRSPVVLVYGPNQWTPTQDDIGFYPEPAVTAQHAMDVGRTESLLVQLLDRLPIHPSHEVPLAYYLVPGRLKNYILNFISNPKARNGLEIISRNAQIVPVAPLNDDFMLKPAHDGLEVDVPATEASVRSILGSLRKQTRQVSVIHTHAAITDAAAQVILNRVRRFLAATPVLGVEKRVFATTRGAFAHMLSFQDVKKDGQWSIQMTVNQDAIHSYVASLASQIDRPAENARMNFVGGRVEVIQPRTVGRTLDQDATYKQILKVVTRLTPRARLHLSVAVTQPPIDTTNPASLGIDRLLAEGTTSFQGAGSTRLDDITAIAKALNDTLITPTQEISFNTLVGTNWLDRVYDDRERGVNGQPVPGNHGAMQQLATTFLRAMYGAGLKVLERHAHPYRLSWYEPPVGLDAEVFPGRNWDLRFANSTNKYLLIETRVEPIRQQLYIYVYGPNLGWKVSVDKLGKVTKTVPHGPAIRRDDPNLPVGTTVQTAWPHDGATTVVQRTITYKNGHVKVDEIDTTYQPWQAIISVGSQQQAQPQPTSVPAPTPGPTPSATAPQPTPSATPNH